MTISNFVHCPPYDMFKKKCPSTRDLGAPFVKTCWELETHMRPKPRGRPPDLWLVTPSNYINCIHHSKPYIHQIKHIAYTAHYPSSTIVGGTNMNLTVLSFLPSSVESFLLKLMSSPAAALSRTLDGCSDSRITIFSRMSWSALYGTGGGRGGVGCPTLCER